MTSIRAVFFDFGGTLYDYSALSAAERESVLDLARWLGIEAEPEAIYRSYRKALKRAFHEYLPRPYYLHRSLFRDALSGLAQDFGAVLDDEHVARYLAAQRERQRRDFRLREDVPPTLEALRSRGLYLALVSNIDEDQLSYMRALGRIDRYFDFVLSSERAGSCKPDAAIFREALRRARCRPSEAIFVGDSLAQDIEGANRAGIPSVLLWHRPDSDPPERGPTPTRVIRRVGEVLTLVGHGDGRAD
jgi:putative hydrolase of the HAD superfamily